MDKFKDVDREIKVKGIECKVCVAVGKNGMRIAGAQYNEANAPDSERLTVLVCLDCLAVEVVKTEDYVKLMVPK